MSKHHNPQRNSMMPAPAQPNPEPAPDAPPLRAYAVNRTPEGWEMRVLLLPRDVVEQYTAKQVADVLPIVIAKVAMDIERVAEGRAGLEHSA
jgi:hypothetical protein